MSVYKMEIKLFPEDGDPLVKGLILDTNKNWRAVLECGRRAAERTIEKREGMGKYQDRKDINLEGISP